MRSLAVCAFTILVPWCALRAETLNRVVAAVDYQAITDRDLVSEYHYEQLLNGKFPKGEPDSKAREEIRNRLVEQALLSQEAQDAGLPLHPEAILHIMPSKSGYIGGDLIGFILASGAADRDIIACNDTNR